MGREIDLERPEPGRDLGEGDGQRCTARAYANPLRDRRDCRPPRRHPRRRAGLDARLPTVTAASHRPPGFLTRLIFVLALLVAGCGATVPSIETSDPTPTRPPVTAAPSVGRFVADRLSRQGGRTVSREGAARRDARRVHGEPQADLGQGRRRPWSSSCAGRTLPSCPRSPTRRSGSTTRPGSSPTSTPGATGPQAIVSAVNGTGPYMLEAWDRGTEVSLARNDGYWGDPAANERVIVRWNPASAQRVNELQAGTVDGIDEVAATGVEAVDADVSMVVAPRAGSRRRLSRDDQHVRAVRQRGRPTRPGHRDRPPRAWSSSFLSPAAELAAYAAPCALPYACSGTGWYEFDATLAKETLAAAGCPDGFDDDDPLLDDAERGPPRSECARSRAAGAAPDEPRHPGRHRRRARGDLPRGCRRGQARRDPPARPGAGLPGRQRVARSAFRNGRDGRERPAVRRHRQGPRQRTVDRERGEARCRLQEGQRRHPCPCPDHPARGSRVGRGVPGRRQGRSRIAASARRRSRG